MSFTYADAFVAIAAVELTPVVQFYEAVFGAPPVVYTSDRYAEFHLAHLRIGLFKPSSQNEQEFPPKSSSISLCIEVINLNSAIDHLKTLGIPLPDTISTASHGREIYFYDPLGNRLILHESTQLEKESRAV